MIDWLKHNWRDCLLLAWAAVITVIFVAVIYNGVVS